MSEENQLPLDADQARDPAREATLRGRNRRLAFFLELIPIGILFTAFALRYFSFDIWWWFFSVGAVMACLNYLFISWFFFRPKAHNTIELLVTIGFAACFIMGIAGIYLRLQSWEGGATLYNLALGGASLLFIFSALMLLYNIRREKKSWFYRISLARFLILIVILLRLI